MAGLLEHIKSFVFRLLRPMTLRAQHLLSFGSGIDLSLDRDFQGKGILFALETRRTSVVPKTLIILPSTRNQVAAMLPKMGSDCFSAVACNERHTVSKWVCRTVGHAQSDLVRIEPRNLCFFKIFPVQHQCPV